MKLNYVLPKIPNPISFLTSSKVGAVAGCPGATTGIKGANSNPGYEYVLKGGKKRRQSYKASRKRKSKHTKSSRRYKGTRRRSHSKSLKKHRKKNKARKSRRFYRSRKRQRGGYSQYLSDVPFAHGYSNGGSLSPSNNALANPVPYKPYNNCQK